MGEDSAGRMVSAGRSHREYRRPNAHSNKGGSTGPPCRLSDARQEGEGRTSTWPYTSRRSPCNTRKPSGQERMHVTAWNSHIKNEIVRASEEIHTVINVLPEDAAQHIRNELCARYCEASTHDFGRNNLEVRKIPTSIRAQLELACPLRWAHRRAAPGR